MNKTYGGTCYVGWVSGTLEFGECRDSIQKIQLRQGDQGPFPARGTTGYRSRQSHFLDWYYDTHHDFMLLLDGDMLFSPDTLERLRAHGQPYVSGYYMRRQFSPVAPTWFEYPERNDDFPRRPWITVPESGKLHPLGGAGWGCMLIHRDVITAVKPLLKGEWEVLEDDMDIYPYDLGVVLTALNALGKPGNTNIETEHYLGVLRNEIRPLRYTKSIVGSDIRYPFFAREAGFTLMGDPDVRPAHMLDYPLQVDDFDKTRDVPDVAANLTEWGSKYIGAEAELINELRQKLGVEA